MHTPIYVNDDFRADMSMWGSIRISTVSICKPLFVRWVVGACFENTIICDNEEDKWLLNFCLCILVICGFKKVMRRVLRHKQIIALPRLKDAPGKLSTKTQYKLMNDKWIHAILLNELNVPKWIYSYPSFMIHPFSKLKNIVKWSIYTTVNLFSNDT